MTTRTLTAVLGIGVALVLTGLLVQPPTLLDAEAQALVRGAVNDKCCNRDVRTCDQVNFGLPCNTQQTGSICLNCMIDDDTEGPNEHLCNNREDDNCETEEDQPCGEKRLGNCAGTVCDGTIQVLGESCAHDARSCPDDDPTNVDVCPF